MIDKSKFEFQLTSNDTNQKTLHVSKQKFQGHVKLKSITSKQLITVKILKVFCVFTEITHENDCIIHNSSVPCLDVR